jgi:hypothetical protein
MVSHRPSAEPADPPRSAHYAVNGYRLFLRVLGHAPPTVVLESGLGRASDDWIEN